MSTTILPRSAGLRLWGFSGTGLTVAVVLGAWFAVVVLLGAAGAFVTAAACGSLSEIRSP